MSTTDHALDQRRKWAVLATCCLSLLIISLDLTILNVALPSLAEDLDAGVAGLQWVIDAYVLVLAGLLVLGGSSGDRFGRRRVFLTGLALFTLASLLCSVAPSLGWLIAFRALQGVGASMLNPVAMSIITNTFTDRAERARAIGVWGGVVGISMAAGPLLGGLLVDGVSWRAIFWINVPVGLAAMALTWVFVPESKAPRARRFDPVGQVLMVVTLTALTAAIIEAPRLGWADGATLALAAAGAVAGVALARYETRRREPLLDFRFFTSLPLTGASLMAVTGFAAISGFLLLNTLYLQDVRGMSALAAGLHTLPMALPVLVCAPLSGRVVAARGPRLPLTVAGVAMTAGALMLTRLDQSTPTAWLMVAYVLFGLGFGTLNPPLTNTAVSGLPPAQSGVAAAITSTSRSVGQLLGIAVIGTVINAGVGGALREKVLGGLGPAWWIVVGCGLTVLAIGLATSTARAQETAERTAVRLADLAAAEAAGRTPVGAR